MEPVQLPAKEEPQPQVNTNETIFHLVRATFYLPGFKHWWSFQASTGSSPPHPVNPTQRTFISSRGPSGISPSDAPGIAFDISIDLRAHSLDAPGRQQRRTPTVDIVAHKSTHESGPSSIIVSTSNGLPERIKTVRTW